MATNSFRCCAERAFLAAWLRRAARHGVKTCAAVAWVRRKVGNSVTVARFQADGTRACSAPCVLCSRELERFGLRAWYVDGDGRLTVGLPDAPRLTSGQRVAFRATG